MRFGLFINYPIKRIFPCWKAVFSKLIEQFIGLIDGGKYLWECPNPSLRLP